MDLIPPPTAGQGMNALLALSSVCALIAIRNPWKTACERSPRSIIRPQFSSNVFLAFFNTPHGGRAETRAELYWQTQLTDR
jgi:hypothetical protein